MVFTVIAIYIFHNAAQDSIQTRNDIPNTDQLIKVIKAEKGEISQTKLLNYTNKLRILLIDKLDDDIKFLDLYNKLLYLCLSITFVWIAHIMAMRKHINGSNNTP